LGSFRLHLVFISCLNNRVGENCTPKASNLMRVVDLHDVELLDDFGVDFKLLLFERRNDLLAQVDRDNVVQDV
jgi:hypothetical protein